MLEQTTKEPERGSFAWWANEFGGAGEDDDPIQVTVYSEHLQEIMPQISLTHFLHALFDASGEVPEAVEQIILWARDWMFDNWHKLFGDIEKLFHDLLELAEWDDDGESQELNREGLRAAVAEKWHRLYCLEDYQQGMEQDEFVREALDAFPINAYFLLISEGIAIEDWVTFYTANHETDFDNEWSLELWLEDGLGTSYAVVRSGYSFAVAEARDRDYALLQLCDLYCRECEAFFDHSYFYNEALNPRSIQHREFLGSYTVTAEVNKRRFELDVSPRDIELAFGNHGWMNSSVYGGFFSKSSSPPGQILFVSPVARTWKEDVPPNLPQYPYEFSSILEDIERVASGQMQVPGMEVSEPPIPLEHMKCLVDAAREYADYYGDTEDFIPPIALVENEDGSVRAVEDREEVGAANLLLWCPECGRYSMMLYNPVYGF